MSTGTEMSNSKTNGNGADSGTVDRLSTARAALAELNSRLDALRSARSERLLAGDPAAVIADIDAQIAAAQHAVTTEADRIALLEQQHAREVAERDAAEHEAHISRVEKSFADRDEAGRQLQKT